MPITVISNIVPANNLKFPIIEDIHLKGGLRVVANSTERDNIDSAARKVGMYVVTVSDGLIWSLDSNLTSWTMVTGSGSSLTIFERATITHTTNFIGSGAYEDFVLPTGKSAVLIKITISGPSRVIVHSSSARVDSNPYVFEAYDGHLTDDGSSKDAMDNIRYNRRYVVVSNVETPVVAATYWRIVNTQATTAIYDLTVTYLPIEQ